MNKLTYIIISIFALLFVGCDNEGDKLAEITGQAVSLSISSTDTNVQIENDGLKGTVVFKTAGGQSRIAVETNQRVWIVDNPGNQWLKIEQNETGLTLSVDVNSGEQALNTSVTITAGSGENTVKAVLDVNQRASGDPELSLDQNKIVFTPKNLEPRRVKVNSNGEDWTFKTETPSFWLLIEKEADNTLVLTPDPNATVMNDTLIIKITAGYGKLAATEELVVINEAIPVILFQPDKLIFMNAGGTETVLVAANQAWQLGEITEAWVKAVAGKDEITVTVEKNTGDNQRSCRIPVICGSNENTTTAYIDVIQWSKEDDLLVLEYTTTSANTPITLPLQGTVNCTIDWGDGTTQEVTAVKPIHQYAQAGVYEVKISGTVTALSNTDLNASAKLLTRVINWGRTGLISMEGAMEGCVNLISIPGDDFQSFSEVTTFKSAFNKCISLKEIPANLLVNASKSTNFRYIFASVSGDKTVLKEIPAGLFDNCINGEDFCGMFWGSTAISVVPEGLFDRTKKAKDFSYVFYQSGITTVPVKLFANCTEIETLTSAFAYTSLVQIPSSLIQGCTKVTDLSYLFQNCKQLKSIPQGLFEGLTAVTNCNYLFSNCELITTIPAGLFTPMTEVTSTSMIFNGCASLTAIPEGLFDPFTKSTNFSGAFQNCATLKTVPAGLFKNSPLINNIGRVFNGCAQLETVPGDIFNCPGVSKANNSASLFQNCTNLKSVPEGLLDSFTEATGFATLFSGCTSLASVPVGLFDECKKVNSFANAFNGCTALTGESPYTLVEGVKVHLYERSTENGFKTPSTKTKCFFNCTGLSDYELIPAAWK